MRLEPLGYIFVLFYFLFSLLTVYFRRNLANFYIQPPPLACKHDRCGFIGFFLHSTSSFRHQHDTSTHLPHTTTTIKDRQGGCWWWFHWQIRIRSAAAPVASWLCPLSSQEGQLRTQATQDGRRCAATMPSVSGFFSSCFFLLLMIYVIFRMYLRLESAATTIIGSSDTSGVWALGVFFYFFFFDTS